VAAAILGISLVIGLLAVIALSSATSFSQRFGSLEGVVSLGGRTALWRSAYEIAAEHPLLGIGPDSFRLGWYPIRPISHLAAGTGLVITDPHSAPLMIAATMGVAGLIAALFLLGATLVAGFRTASDASQRRGSAGDYGAWLWGAIALSVALLVSLTNIVLTFMLFVALGVLTVPRLQPIEGLKPGSAWARSLQILALLAALALLWYGLAMSASQVVAGGARSEDALANRTRASQAAALAPWDSGIRSLKYDTAVNAALSSVFGGETNAGATVEDVESQLVTASRREPFEYLHLYRQALLLVASGERLGDELTVRGIRAGLSGLDIYPNSLELRTGMATGYLQLGRAPEAEAILQDIWSADPNYPQSGIVYVQSLLEQDKTDQARAAVLVLFERFPDDAAVGVLNAQTWTQ
jgi:hypothetical protein